MTVMITRRVTTSCMSMIFWGVKKPATSESIHHVSQSCCSQFALTIEPEIDISFWMCWAKARSVKSSNVKT